MHGRVRCARAAAADLATPPRARADLKARLASLDRLGTWVEQLAAKAGLHPDALWHLLEQQELQQAEQEAAQQDGGMPASAGAVAAKLAASSSQKPFNGFISPTAAAYAARLGKGQAVIQAGLEGAQHYHSTTEGEPLLEASASEPARCAYGGVGGGGQRGAVAACVVLDTCCRGPGGPRAPTAVHTQGPPACVCHHGGSPGAGGVRGGGHGAAHQDKAARGGHRSSRRCRCC